jgi:methionyl-tRNA formyltransferase|tara:strand:+ start:3980 stop:4975 length:996 start_codon:yes stop_codon:yes gene_type:complete
MGSDPIALPFLKSLPESLPAIELVGVFTQPDRPKGRGQKLQANAIKEWATEENLIVHQPARCGLENENWLATNEVDLILVMAYGQILKASLIDTPSIGTFNLHASLLPRLRGASPIHTAIASGEEKTGVSLMRIVPALDAGPFCAQEEISITPTTTASSLIEEIAVASVGLIKRALPSVLDHSAQWTEQAAGDVTYCRRIFKEDAQLDFNQTAASLEQRIRAFRPWPGSVFEYKGTILKIGSAVVVREADQPVGTLVCEESEVTLACGDGALRLTALQRPGGRLLPAKEFLLGFPLESGTVIASKPMAPLVALKAFPWEWRPGDEDKESIV